MGSEMCIRDRDCLHRDRDRVCFANDNVDTRLRDLLAFDGATVVDGPSGVIRAIRYKIQPSASGRQRYKLDGHGTKHNSCLYASEVAPYVAVVRSDDGNITVFTPEASARGECFRCDPRLPATPSSRARAALPEGAAPADLQMPRGPDKIQLKTVPLPGFATELPRGIEPAVFSLVLDAADRVRTNEGKAHGTIFLLAPGGEDLDDVGYGLDDSGMTLGFVEDNVCFVNGTECDSIDKQLADLLAFDGATVVDGVCLLYTSPSPRDGLLSRMPSSA